MDLPGPPARSSCEQVVVPTCEVNECPSEHVGSGSGTRLKSAQQPRNSGRHVIVAKGRPLYRLMGAPSGLPPNRGRPVGEDAFTQ
eukprot:6189580-Alexandrium_andersonii.AAC.1